MPLVPLATQTAPESSDYNGSRLVNVYAHPAEGKSPAVLYGRHGMVEFVDLGTGKPVEAVEKVGTTLYAVSDGSVYKIVAGVASVVGTVSKGATYMASNGTQLAIVANETYYVCDGTTTTAYTTGAVDIPRGVAVMDGYFIVIGQVAGRDDGFTISALDDATTFDAAEFAFAESNPDPLVGVIVDHNELWMFGTETVQPFYNSGDTIFPFAPNRGALIEEGCKSGKSLAKADNAVFWVTLDGKVARSFGSGPQWISTPEIAEALRSATLTGSFTFSERGHEFYALGRYNDTSLVYDITTGFWHERALGLNYQAWPPCCVTNISGVEYYGTNDGRIATASNTFTDFGGVLAAEVITPLSENMGNLYRVSRVHIDIASGGTDIGRTPQAMLQTTRDGFNWSEEKWRELGGVSNYAKRAAWHSLGVFREGALRIRITDAVKRDFVGLAVQANG